MRNPRSPAWARSAVFAAALTLAAAGFAPGAAAEEKYQQLFVFGDSYADLTLGDPNLTGVPGISFWNVYPIPLAANLRISKSVDFAVGGATASPNGSPAIDPFLNLPQQVDTFDPDANSFGPRDLVTINIGGNDIRAILGNSAAENKAFGYPEEVINPLNAKTFADTTTGLAIEQIDRLVGAGARTFMLGGFNSISGLPELQEALKGLPPNVAKIIEDSADGYAQAYFEEMQAQLVPYARSGVRFFMFDLARLGEDVEADPAKYGFKGGFICPQNGLPDPFSAVCGATPSNPTNRNDLQNQYYFGPDGLHLTNGGFALVADYMAKIVMAPDTISVQPGIVTSTTDGFVGSLLGRLGGVRQAMQVSGYSASGAVGGPMGLGYTDRSRSRRAGPSSRLTTYAMGTFLGGSRDDSADVVGLDYDATSGTAGIEYSVNRNLIVGFAGNYTATNADLNDGAGVDLDAIQAAAYLSYATRQVFAEAIAAYGAHDIGLDRPGVIDTIRSDTDASAFALAARGGYLFDFGSLRAGPIAGLTYIRARVDGYTEDGDDLLTFNVSEQELDSLAGNLGLRFLAPFRTTGGNFVIPYLNVMLEHQFGDDTRTLTVDQVQTTLFLPISTSFPNFETRTYGRVEGGVTFQMGPNVSTTINAASTFARDEANDFRIGAALNYRF